MMVIVGSKSSIHFSRINQNKQQNDSMALVAAVMDFNSQTMNKSYRWYTPMCENITDRPQSYDQDVQRILLKN